MISKVLKEDQITALHKRVAELEKENDRLVQIVRSATWAKMAWDNLQEQRREAKAVRK